MDLRFVRKIIPCGMLRTPLLSWLEGSSSAGGKILTDSTGQSPLEHVELFGVAMGMLGVCGISKKRSTVLYCTGARTVEKFRGFPISPKSRQGEVFGLGWNERLSRHSKAHLSPAKTILRAF